MSEVFNFALILFRLPGVEEGLLGASLGLLYALLAPDSHLAKLISDSRKFLAVSRVVGFIVGGTLAGYIVAKAFPACPSLFLSSLGFNFFWLVKLMKKACEIFVAGLGYDSKTKSTSTNGNPSSASTD